MIRTTALLAGSFLCFGTAVLTVVAAPTGLTDIPGTTPQCRDATDQMVCLQNLKDGSAARLRRALAKARTALKRSSVIADADRAAAIDTLERTQKAWRIYARMRCEAEVPVTFTGGTGRNHAVLTCLRVHDEHRTAALLDIAGME